MGALDEYVEMATGGGRPQSIHPDMDAILKDTNYCMIYQEQLLDIVKKFGGRTYGGADLFRKAIGKKIKELVQKESEILRNEIIANGYPKEIADKIANELSQKVGTFLTNRTAFHMRYYALRQLGLRHIIQLISLRHYSTRTRIRPVQSISIFLMLLIFMFL